MMHELHGLNRQAQDFRRGGGEHLGQGAPFEPEAAIHKVTCQKSAKLQEEKQQGEGLEATFQERTEGQEGFKLRYGGANSCILEWSRRRRFRG